MFPQVQQLASLLVSQTPAEGGCAGAGGQQFFLMIGMVAIFYFILIRPQAKEHKAQQTLLESLKRGDEVVTKSGLIGKIADISEQIVTLEVAKNTKVRVLKHVIGKKLELKADSKADASGNAAKASKK